MGLKRPKTENQMGDPMDESRTQERSGRRSGVDTGVKWTQERSYLERSGRRSGVDTGAESHWSGVHWSEVDAGTEFERIMFILVYTAQMFLQANCLLYWPSFDISRNMIYLFH